MDTIRRHERAGRTGAGRSVSKRAGRAAILIALAAGGASCRGTITINGGGSGTPSNPGRPGNPGNPGPAGNPGNPGPAGTPDKPGGVRPPEPLPANCQGDDCAIQQRSSRLAACPSGSCDPGPVNGKGVYVVTGGNYCFPYNGKLRFCPETFVNAPNTVVLFLHDADDANVVYTAKVSAVLVKPGLPERPVELLGVTANRTQLAIRYRDGVERTATGAELGALRLDFTILTQRTPVAGPQGARYQMTFRPAPGNGGAPPGLLRYEASYRQADGPPDFKTHCLADARPRSTSFLGGKKIDGLTAEVTNDASAVTMSCETGAIEACLGWGYSPWNPKARTPANGDYLFGSCLQAKRAAYFIGRGDPTSYTKSGTEINVRDPFGIMTRPAPPLEAIWSPRGAECLNGDQLRRPELRGTLAIPPGVPRCSPVEWSRFGKLATGPALP